MFHFVNRIKESRAARKAIQIEVHDQALKEQLLRKATHLIEDRPLSEATAKGVLSELLELFPRCARLLTLGELRLLEGLKVDVEGVVRREACSGYCNVNSTDAHAGPCLHPDGVVEVYGTISLDCTCLVRQVELEIDRRSSISPS